MDFLLVRRLPSLLALARPSSSTLKRLHLSYFGHSIFISVRDYKEDAGGINLSKQLQIMTERDKDDKEKQREAVKRKHREKRQKLREQRRRLGSVMSPSSFLHPPSPPEAHLSYRLAALASSCAAQRGSLQGWLTVFGCGD
ncbi:hypothetical protein Zmor_004134 [Zophobas morio]|uniref:Uncharacterized protein n=1 Tax=Zophobas morio TaxID=2755281 RepID=A0AA38HKS5_9CUCU|nr:hypothetical protein Zmor_004134 [Zophobas morio]